MAKKYDAYKHMLASLLDNASDADNRLTIGALHALVTDALGGEPLVIAAAIHERLSAGRSKFTVHPQALFDMAIKVHDRLYPMPDYRTRKTGEDENQFQLSFAWAPDELESQKDEA